MKFKKFANSLVTRLIAMGLLLAVAGTAASYVQLTRFLREDLTQSVAAQQTALAGYVARDVDHYLDDRQQFLERLALTMPPALLTQPRALQDWLVERHALNPMFSLGLTVAGPDGHVLGLVDPVSPSADRIAVERIDFAGALAGRATIGRPLASVVSQHPALPIAVPIKAGDGHVAAVLVGTTDLSTDGLLDRLQQARVGRTGGILLISPRDRLFVVSTDPAMNLRPTPPEGVNRLHDRAMTGFRGSGTTVNADGVEEISAMASVPSSGWFVVARLPAVEAFSTVARVQDFILHQRALAVAAVMTLIGCIVAWLLRPLVRAARQAEQMTRGDQPLAPLQVVRSDEIGELTAAFNRLLAKLADHQAELGRLAHHDSLTGLPNRKLLADRLQQALARAQRHAGQVAVLYLDLDGFKKLNDSLGHEAGDLALQETARRLLAVVRQTDTVARLGGDEFVLLAADFEEPAEEAVCALAQKCIAALAQPMKLRAADVVIGVSIGIVLADGRESPDTLLAAADTAMYRAKQSGRSNYAVAPLVRLPLAA